MLACENMLGDCGLLTACFCVVVLGGQLSIVELGLHVKIFKLKIQGAFDLKFLS